MFGFLGKNYVYISYKFYLFKLQSILEIKLNLLENN